MVLVDRMAGQGEGGDWGRIGGFFFCAPPLNLDQARRLLSGVAQEWDLGLNLHLLRVCGAEVSTSERTFSYSRCVSHNVL